MLGKRGVVLTVVAAAYGMSSMGDQMAILSLTLRLHDQGHSGVAVSALVVAGVLPLVVVGPLAAPLVDRVESARLVVVVTALQGLVSAGLVFVTGLAGTLVLLVLLGAGLALASPALLLLVPEIVGAEGTARGYARLDAFRSAGNVAGPALAGVLIAAFDVRVVLLANTATFAVMAVVLSCLGVRRQPAAGAGGSWPAQVREGVRVLGGDRLLRTAILALASAIVFTAVLSVARVFFIRDDLGVSGTGYGFLVSAHTVGMLAASTLIAPRVPLEWQPRVLVGAGVLMGTSLAVGAAVPVFALALVSFVLTGVANSLQGLAIRNLIHARVPEGVRGRAFATSGATLNGANLVGTALGGPATALLGGAGALELAGAGTLLVTLAGSPVLLRHHAGADAPGRSPARERGAGPARE